MADKVMRMPAPAIQQKSKKDNAIAETPVIQRKCEACKKEETQNIQRKFASSLSRESGSQNPTTTLRNRIVQRKQRGSTNSKDHISSEQDELKIQTKTNSNSQRGPPSSDFSSTLSQSKGSGQAMDSNTQSFMNSRFGTDFSNVKIHTGNNASQMSNSINAKAFTHQNNIYFNKGQYQPNTHAGKSLLAHELTHTIQQGAVNNTVQAKLAIGAPDDKYEREADSMADRVMRMPENGVQRKCASCENEELIQRSVSGISNTNLTIQKAGLSDDEKAALIIEIDNYRERVETKNGEKKEIIRKKLIKLIKKHKAADFAIIAETHDSGYFLVSLLSLDKDFNFLINISTRWRKGKEYVVNQMEGLPLGKRNEEGIKSELSNIKGTFPFDELYTHRRTEKEKPGWNVFGRISTQKKSVTPFAGVDDLTKIKTGKSVNEAHQIKWYKPPEAYKEIHLKNRAMTKGRVQTIESKKYIKLVRKGGRTVYVRIGVVKRVASRGSSRRVVDNGDVLIRKKTPKRNKSVGDYRDVLIKCGFNWEGMDADHVVDLGFGGKDVTSNLWPLDAGINRRAYNNKYYSNYKIVVKKDKKHSEIIPIKDLYGSRFRIKGFIKESKNTYPLGGIQTKCFKGKTVKPKKEKEKKKSRNQLREEKPLASNELKSCVSNNKKEREKQNTEVEKDRKATLKERLFALQEKVKDKITCVKQKVKDFIEKIKLKLIKLLKNKKGSSIRGWGRGLISALARAGFKLLKIILASIFKKTINNVRLSILNNIDRMKEKFKNELTADLPQLEKNYSKLENIYSRLRDKFEENLEKVTEKIVKPFSSLIDSFKALKKELGKVADLVNAVRWIYRIMACCCSPPIIGCLWIAVQSITEVILTKIVSSCMFQLKIMPHLLGLEFVKNMPKNIAGYIEKGIHYILPDFAPTVRQEAVSREGLYCEKVSEEQKLFIELHDALGEDKLKALEKLMKKLKLSTSLPYTEDRVKRIIENVKSSGLTASDIEELAKKYNTDAPLSNTLISLKELLDELQNSDASTGKPNKNKKQLANKSELLKIENWLVLDEKKKKLQPKHDFSDKDLIFTFTNNLVVHFIEGSKIEIKEKEIAFENEKENVQIIKIKLKVKVYKVPKKMTGITVGEEFSAYKMFLWRIKAEKFIPLYKNKKIENATEFVKGKLKLIKSKQVIKYRFVDLQINKIVHQFKNGNRIDYKLEVVPVEIDKVGASYFDGEKHRVFKKGSKVILSFHKAIPKPKPATSETITTPLPKTTPPQPKLKVGTPNDKYEQEADRTADRIIRMPKDSIQPKLNKGISTNIQRKTWDKEEQYNPYNTKTKNKIQRKCASCQVGATKEDKTLQLTLSGKSGGETINNNFQSSLNTSKGNGHPMDSYTQSFMENRFGNDFSNVNIHTGAKSTELNNQIQAKAFTTGNDIYFNQGQYNPKSAEGKHLLAHELTHTIQQGASKDQLQRSPDLSEESGMEIFDYGIAYSKTSKEVTLYGQSEYESTDQNSQIPIGTKLRVLAREGSFYKITLFNDSSITGYISQEEIVQAILDDERDLTVENDVYVIDKETFKNNYPQLGDDISSLYWNYLALVRFVESLNRPAEYREVYYRLYNLNYMLSLGHEQRWRNHIEMRNDYSAKNLLLWIQAVDSVVNNIIPLVEIEEDSTGIASSEASSFMEYIQDGIQPTIEYILTNDYFLAGHRYMENSSVIKAVEDLEYEEQSKAEKALPYLIDFLNVNKVNVETQSEYNVYGALFAQLLSSNQRISSLNRNGFGLSANDIREVFGLLRNENTELAEQALYKGETMSWLLSNESMSGFSDFRASGEGLLSGLERGYYEEMNTTEAAPFESWNAVDAGTFYLWYSLGVPSGLALGAKDLVVGLVSLFTPSFWKEMYTIFTDEAHRFEIGTGLGEALAKEIRTYQAGDPSTIGWKLGVLMGRIGFEIIFTLLTSGAFQLSKVSWATKFPRLARVGEAIASTRVAQIAASGASFIIGKLDDIARTIRGLMDKLPALTANQRMNRQIAVLQRELDVLEEAAKAAKALALTDELEAASSAIARLEEQTVIIDRRLAEMGGNITDPNGVSGAIRQIDAPSARGNMEVVSLDNGTDLLIPVEGPPNRSSSILDHPEPDLPSSSRSTTEAESIDNGTGRFVNEEPSSIASSSYWNDSKPTSTARSMDNLEAAGTSYKPKDSELEALFHSPLEPKNEMILYGNSQTNTPPIARSLPLNEKVLVDNQMSDVVRVYTAAEGTIDVRAPAVVISRPRRGIPEPNLNPIDEVTIPAQIPRGGSTSREILEVFGEETRRTSPETRTARDGTRRQMSVAESDRLAEGHRISFSDLRSKERRTKVADSHDMGVERGRVEAISNEIILENWNNPESYIGLYGRGIDDLGRNGNVWVILEWKGGRGAKLAEGQMSHAWVGRKLAELEHLNDPMAGTLLDAARNGLLEGRVYTTVTYDMTSLTNSIQYNYTEVHTAYQRRLTELQ